MTIMTVPGKLTAQRTDRQTDGQNFSFIYVDYNSGHPSSHVCMHILALM